MARSNILSIIQGEYHTFTDVEKLVADYILNTPDGNLSAQNLCNTLYISKASLTRFAQKLGFSGFRELKYQVYQDLTHVTYPPLKDSITKSTFNNYSYIVNETFCKLHTSALEKAISLIANSNHIYVYGDGLSGYAAGEFMIRFKRLGFSVESCNNDFMMQTNSAIVHSSALVIGISLSGDTKNTLTGLRNAHKNGAKTMLITSKQKKYPFDVVLYTVSLSYMNSGMQISPQLPILIIIDILFSHFINDISGKHVEKYQDTVKALTNNNISKNSPVL